MALIPYRVVQPTKQWPVANIVIIVLCVDIHLLIVLGIIPPELRELFVLRDWSLMGLLGHQFLHGDFSQLVFNMLFLAVFGNVICSNIGNARYIAASRGKSIGKINRA